MSSAPHAVVFSPGKSEAHMAAAAFAASTSSQAAPAREPESKEANIQVVVRLRPRSQKEIRENSSVCVTTNGTKGKEIHVKTTPSDLSSKTYTFDKAFGPDADQELVYHEVVAPMLEEVLMGYNCTLFAYGQTGTGKTYTMEGSLEGTVFENTHAGIIPRALHQLFTILESTSTDYSVRVSMLELYNEELNDLLGVDGLNTKLRLFEDAKGRGSVVIQGLEEVLVKNVKDVLGVLRKGAERRQTAGTLMNDNRSHCVFSITVHTKEATPEGEDLLKVGSAMLLRFQRPLINYVQVGKLNLVDLAGSENIGRSGAESKRAREAGMINQSLLTLGRVINNLVEKSQHIPYRESKLTRLLQDSLGGRTKTCIIATISPARVNLDESLSTLDYAHRAKNIRNKPEVNQRMTKKALIREYVSEIERLKVDLLAAREKAGVYLTLERYNELMEDQQGRKDRIDELTKASTEREETLKRREEALQQVRNELVKERSKLTLVEAEYERVRIALAKTEQHLEETRTMLREQQVLTQSHQATEAKLDDVAKTLHKVATGGLADLDAVHDKLERKIMVEELNDAVISDFRQSIRNRLASLSSSSNKFREDRTTELQTLGQALLHWREAAEHEHARGTEMLQQQTDSVLEALQGLLAYSETALTEPMKTQLADMERLLAELSQSVGSMAKSDEASWSQLLGSWEAFSSQWDSEIEQWAEQIEEGASEIRVAMETHSASLQRKLNESAAEVEERLNQQFSLLSDQYAQVESLLARQAEEAERRQTEALQTINSLLLAMSEQRAKDHSELTRRLASSNENGMKAFQDVGRAFASTKAATEEQQRQLSAGIDRSVRALQAAKENAMGRENAQRAAWERAMVEGRAKASERRSADLASFTAMGGQLGGAVSMATATVASFANGHKTAAEASRLLVDRNLEIARATLGAGFEGARQRIDDLDSWKQRSAKADASRGQDHDWHIATIAESTNSLLDRDLKKDESTGSTPPRRKYRYPQSWDLTRPHDVILAEFRSSAAAAAATLPTPVSPDDALATSDSQSDIYDEDIRAAEEAPLPPSRSESRASERNDAPQLERSDSRGSVASGTQVTGTVGELRRPASAQSSRPDASKIPGVSVPRTEGGTKLPMAKGPVKRTGTTSTVFTDGQ
ncbi:kinesin-domain-containing protein [Hyaloraphidium curvatum]|nr:kinesin-domain-containing protein [Hyaloraphidium curvatum]